MMSFEHPTEKEKKEFRERSEREEWEKQNSLKQSLHSSKCQRCKRDTNKGILMNCIGLDCTPSMAIEKEDEEDARMWMVSEREVVSLCQLCYDELLEWLNIPVHESHISPVEDKVK